MFREAQEHTQRSEPDYISYKQIDETPPSFLQKQGDVFFKQGQIDHSVPKKLVRAEIAAEYGDSEQNNEVYRK